MTFLEQFETELAGYLETGKDTPFIVRYASEKILESYRNGIKAGKEGKTVIRDGKSRRRYAPDAPFPKKHE